jgi:hypothetical protein
MVLVAFCLEEYYCSQVGKWSPNKEAVLLYWRGKHGTEVEIHGENYEEEIMHVHVEDICMRLYHTSLENGYLLHKLIRLCKT